MTGKWENTELSKGSFGYDMKNVNGLAVVKYWGDNPSFKQAFSKIESFYANASDYCVS